jgi:hypothetical protein
MTALPTRVRDSYVAFGWGSTLPQPLTKLAMLEQ